MLLIAVKILMNNHLTWRLNPYFSIFEQEEKRLKIVSLFKFLHNRSITNPSKIEKEILSACSNYKTSWHLLLIISWTVTYCHDFVWIGPWFLHTNNFVLKDEKFGQSITIRVETRKDYFFQRLRWQFEIKILYIHSGIRNFWC